MTLVGIAKGRDRDAGRETFFRAGQPPFKLPPRDPALYFVQRLRDEAHRFAIGAHRAKRKREMVKNPLDEIPGIGPTRKRALLHHFGTVKAIQRAALEDLMKAPGVNGRRHGPCTTFPCLTGDMTIIPPVCGEDWRSRLGCRSLALRPVALPSEGE